MKKKLKLTKEPTSRNVLLQFRVTPEEADIIIKKAKKNCDGNVSEYARYAALKFEPAERDFQK